MRYKCCKYIHNGMCFMLNRIKTCNDLHYGVVLFDTETDGNVIDIEKVFEKRRELVENCKKGIYFEPCVNCDKFVEDEWDDNINIIHLSIFHWLHCNCACVYCFQDKERKAIGGYSENIEKSQYYEAYPVLKYLYDHNMMEKDKLRVEFGGGEPAILKELPDLISLINKNGFEFCLIMSSGIRYSEDIEKLLQNPNTQFTVTIAAGSPEIYKKIKQRDKFFEVKNNLKRYIANSANPDNIWVRYLIYEGINDTEKDIKDWLDMCVEINAKSVEMTFEFCQSFNEKKGQPYPPHLKELIDYYLEEGKKTNLHCLVDMTTQGIIARGYY